MSERASDRARRARGALLGLAAGDRNGGPIRFAVRLAESLAECGGFVPGDVARRYVEWWRAGALDTGPVAEAVFRGVVEHGLDMATSAERAHAAFGGLTAGCNPAHRCVPLAMAAALSDGDLAGAAIREARLTHLHELAGETAAAVTVICRRLVEGDPWQDALGAAARGRAELVAAALRPDEAAVLSRGGFAPDTLRAAVAFVNAQTSFETAMAASLTFAGPANYCPVLVGAIAGARWGDEAVPRESLRHEAKLLPRISAAAEALALGWKERRAD